VASQLANTPFALTYRALFHKQGVAVKILKDEKLTEDPDELREFNKQVATMKGKRRGERERERERKRERERERERKRNNSICFLYLN